MEVFYGSVSESLTHDWFQNTDVPYIMASDDKRNSSLFKKYFIEVLRGQMKIANDNYFMFGHCLIERNRDFGAHPLNFEFFAELNMYMKSHITSSVNLTIQWNQNRGTMPKLLI